MNATIFLTWALAFFVAADPPAKTDAADHHKTQGRWKVIAMEESGKKPAANTEPKHVAKDQGELSLGSLDPLLLDDKTAILGHVSVKSIHALVGGKLSDFIPKGMLTKDDVPLFTYMFDHIDEIAVAFHAHTLQADPPGLVLVQFNRPTKFEDLGLPAPMNPKTHAGHTYELLGDKTAIYKASPKQYVGGTEAQLKGYLERLGSKKAESPSKGLAAALKAIDREKPIWAVAVVPAATAKELANDFGDQRLRPALEDLKWAGFDIDVTKATATVNFGQESSVDAIMKELGDFIGTMKLLNKDGKEKPSSEIQRAFYLMLESSHQQKTGHRLHIEIDMPSLSKKLLQELKDELGKPFAFGPAAQQTAREKGLEQERRVTEQAAAEAREKAAAAKAPKGTAPTNAAEHANVKVISISERRAKQFDKQAFTEASSLTIKVEVQSETIKNTQKYGNLHIAEGHDDLHNDLVRRAKSDDTFAFDSTDRPAFNTLGSNARQNGKLLIDINLKPPARNAKSVTLKGTLDLISGGEPVPLDFPNATSLVGKELKHKDLDAAGVKIKIIKPENLGGFGGDKPAQGFSYTIEGNDKMIEAVTVVDAAGKEIKEDRGAMTVTSGNVKGQHLYYSKAFDDNVAVRVKLLKGGKAITVPLEATVELP